MQIHVRKKPWILPLKNWDYLPYVPAGSKPGYSEPELLNVAYGVGIGWWRRSSSMYMFELVSEKEGESQ